MKDIKKVAVLGASGNMGSLSGGIFAQNHIPVKFFARTLEKAEAGKKAAVSQSRSEIIGNYIECFSYDDLEKEIADCDWIFEGLAEDMEIKNEYFARVDKARKSGSIVSTVSSGLSINGMAAERSDDFKAHFMGTHFYNPPGKLPANELIFADQVPNDLKQFVIEYCEKILRRVNIETHDTAAFAGNRIGFQLLNEAAIYAEKYGVEKIDYLLGPFTGRAMAPLATIDLVGLDVHKAIVDNVANKVKDERHETYLMPDYMKKMMEQGKLGLKTKAVGGFFFRSPEKEKFALDPASCQYIPLTGFKLDWVEAVKVNIYDGNYAKAVNSIATEKGEEADIIRHFLLGYISYSYHRIGEVTPESDHIHGIDRVMSSGFSWLPPSGWVELFGGPTTTIDLMNQANLPVPDSLKNEKTSDICQVRQFQRYLAGR